MTTISTPDLASEDAGPGTVAVEPAGATAGESSDDTSSAGFLGWAVVPGALALAALMLHVCANAVLRYMDQPLYGTLERTAYWYMPLMVFLGFVIAQRRGEHIEAPIVFDRMPRASQRVTQLLTQCLVAAFAALLAHFGWTEAMSSYEVRRTAGASGITIWPFVFAVPLGYALLAVQVVIDAVRQVRIAGQEPVERGSGFAAVVWVVLPIMVLAACFGAMFANVSDEVIGGLSVIAMLVLMLMKTPLGAAMALPGVIGLMAMTDWQVTLGMLSRLPFEQSASWSLSVIPMFILMGLFLHASGLTAKLYVVARHWVGRLPGSLAVGTNLAGAGLASMTGSTLGSVFPLARAGIPEMLRAGYDRRLAAASVMAAGTLAPLIPPSMLMVIYAGVAQVSVGQQLLAGIVPGILLVLIYGTGIVLLGLVRPDMVGGRSTVRSTWSQKFTGLRDVIPIPALVVVVVVGIYTGMFTATEAGAAGALGAMAVVLFLRRRDRPVRALWKALVDTVSTVGSIFFLLIGAVMLSRLLSISGLAEGFADKIVEMNLGRVEFLLLLVVVYMVLGTFMDSLAMILLTVPILLPLMGAMGISEIWFGVFAVIFMEIAIVTPPMGVLSYVVHGIAQNKEVNVGTRISLGDVFMAAALFLPLILLLVGIIIAFPEIVTWIPENSAGD